MKKSGFTLIELSIAVSIFCILAAALYGTYFNELKYSKYIEDSINAQNSAKITMEAIVNAIQNNIGKLDVNASTIDSISKLVYSPSDSRYIINFTGVSTGDIYLSTVIDSSGNSLFSLKYNDGSLLCDNIDRPQISLDRTSKTINITLYFYISRRPGHLTMYNQAEKYMLQTSINYSK